MPEDALPPSPPDAERANAGEEEGKDRRDGSHD